MGQWSLAPEITNFSVAARHYCEFIEAAHEYILAERLVRCAAVLANLYAAALYLPFEEKPEDSDEPPAPAEVKDWVGFEELTLFWQVPDAYAWGAPAVISLTDTLLNTYHDVKRGLLLFERGYSQGSADEIAYAAWYWRYHMENYWGAQAVDALRALNRAMQKVSSGQRDF
jgi:hypothetical protein